MNKKLERSFYARPDVVAVSRELLGKVLVTHVNGVTTAGIITETEAYMGAVDKASHAYGGKVTPRNKIMYGQAGHAYIYLCYGIHHLF
ncbi:MAG TPA: DNA-3-methyladenine glycosylase, partial [Flavobacteriales bacterium]|nr:DNA-3-methyladenine glycosylase [Flavobacteriales bacterium]